MKSNKPLLNIFLDLSFWVIAALKGLSIYLIIIGRTGFVYLLVYAIIVGYVILYFRLNFFNRELKKMFSIGQPIYYYPIAYLGAIVACPIITAIGVEFVLYDIVVQIVRIIRKKRE